MIRNRPKKKQLSIPGGAQSNRVPGRIYRPGVTPAMIRRRSKELAKIRGLPAGTPTKADRAEAKRELLGTVRPISDEIEEPIRSRQWDPTPSSTGHRGKTIRPQDQGHTKSLVEEGVDEAEHDQMMAARKAQR